MIQTTTRIAVSRNIRDVYLRRRYKVEARFPGGRTIIKAQAETRTRAFKKALVANAPQTSPTAAAGGVSYVADPEAASGGGVAQWQQRESNYYNFEF